MDILYEIKRSTVIRMIDSGDLHLRFLSNIGFIPGDRSYRIKHDNFLMDFQLAGKPLLKSKFSIKIYR